MSKKVLVVIGGAGNIGRETILLAKKLLENPVVLISKVEDNMAGKDFGLRDHPIFEEVENLPDNDPAVVEMVQQFPMMI